MVAQSLFAERGIDGVTVADITVAAGQSNRSAVNYHFGGKDGLVEAVLEGHQPGIESRRLELIADIEGKGRPTLRDWVRTLVLPLGELLDDAAGVAYLRIVAQLIGHPRLVVLGHHRAAVEQGGDRILAALGRARESNRKLWLSRWILVTGSIFHGLADYARMREEDRDSLPAPEEFIDELIDAVTALIRSPSSSTTKKARRTGPGRKTRRNK